MRIVILGSGSGSNAKAIIQAQQVGQLGKANCVALAADREGVPFLGMLQYLNSGRVLIPVPSGPNLMAKLNKNGLNAYQSGILILRSGWLAQSAEATLLNAFSGRIINSHPSLLPAFPGLHSIRQAHEYGALYSGCTVHWVTPTVDAGPIIDQTAVRIEKASLESIETRARCRTPTSS